MASPTLSGVIFDFNGTLFWDTPLHNQAWDMFLAGQKKALTDEEKRNLHGKNNQQIFRYLFGEGLTDAEIAAYVAMKEGHYQQLCLQNPMSLAPGAIDFLDFLQMQGIPFTIATASGKENVDFYFEHLKLARWFNYDRVVYNNGEVRSKPDPQIFELAIDQIGRKPTEVLILEDSVFGIQAAERANPRKVLIVNSNDDDYSDFPHAQIRHFNQINRGWFV